MECNTSEKRKDNSQIHLTNNNKCSPRYEGNFPVTRTKCHCLSAIQNKHFLPKTTKGQGERYCDDGVLKAKNIKGQNYTLAPFLLST